MATGKFDVVIRNGIVVDGAEHTGTHADVGIRDGRIISVGAGLPDSAARVIDAKGLVVAPGFIDMHSHSDFIIPVTGSADSFVRQGITTAVVGMCGSSLAPIGPLRRKEFLEEMAKFTPQLDVTKISWNTFGEYLDAMGQAGTAINFAFVVGYEALRITAGAGFENRYPTPEELRSMKQLLQSAMNAGAFGMSTGLIYSPQVYAATSEIVELTKALVPGNGLYFSHIRGEGATVFDAIREVETIVSESGCRGGHIAHHKIADPKLWGQSTRSLKLIQDINKRGISLTFDSYPYDRGCSSLITALPPWAREGGTEKALERVGDAVTRERIVKEISQDIKTDSAAAWENWIYNEGFANMFISTVGSKKWEHTTGLSFTEIAEREGLDEWDVFFSILVDDKGSTMITTKMMSEEDVRRIMTSEYQTFGTDGMAAPPDCKSGIDHPRSYGTYPRVLGRYVREEGLLPLHEAIAKMTSRPAARLGLRDRGRIKPGLWADVVAFDPATIIDTATYEKPNEFPIGVEYVLVNGKIVVEGHTQHPVFPGMVLRSTLSPD